MLLCAEHPGALAKLAVFSRHLLREFRFPELSLEPGHLLVEVLVLLGDLGQESAALLHQWKYRAEVLLELLLAFDPLAEIFRLQVQDVHFQGLQQPEEHDDFFIHEAVLENLLT